MHTAVHLSTSIIGPKLATLNSTRTLYNLEIERYYEYDPVVC